MQWPVGLGIDVDELTEDADDLAAGIQGHRADLDADALAVFLDQDDLGVGHLRGAGDLRGEHLARATRFLGRAHRVNCRPVTSPTIRFLPG